MLGSEYHVFLTNNGQSKNDAKIKRNTLGKTSILFQSRMLLSMLSNILRREGVKKY